MLNHDKNDVEHRVAPETVEKFLRESAAEATRREKWRRLRLFLISLAVFCAIGAALAVYLASRDCVDVVLIDAVTKRSAIESRCR